MPSNNPSKPVVDPTYKRARRMPRLSELSGDDSDGWPIDGTPRADDGAVGETAVSEDGAEQRNMSLHETAMPFGR